MISFLQARAMNFNFSILTFLIYINVQDIASKSQKSMARFDANLYSEPMATVNLLYEFERCNTSQHAFCNEFNVSYPRIKRLLTTRNNLRDRVATALGENVNDLYLRIPLSKMSHLHITLLRLINVWLFHGNLIQLKVNKDVKKAMVLDDSICLKLSGNVIEEHHVHQLLDKTRHPFVLKTYRNTTSTGNFQPVNIDEDLITLEFNDFENRMLSVSKVRRFNLIISYYQRESISIYAPSRRRDEIELLIGNQYSLEKILLVTRKKKQKQGWGWRSRNCGMFDFERKEANYNTFEQESIEKDVLLKYCFTNDTAKFSRKTLNNAFKKLRDKAKITHNSFDMLSISIGEGSVDGGETSLDMQAYGDFDPLSDKDMNDLLGTPEVSLHMQEINPVQTIILSPTPQELVHSSKSSCQEPLLKYAHESFGILSSVASLQRNTPVIYFHDDKERSQKNKHEQLNNIKVLVKDSKVNDRWRQFPSGGRLLLNKNNFPSTIFPVEDIEVYACCANSLLIRGGMVRVEGITILPSKNSFFPLAMRCIGVKYKEVDDLPPPSDLKDLADFFFESFHGFDSLDYQPSAVQMLKNIFNLNGKDSESEPEGNHEETYIKYLVEKMGENIPSCFLDLSETEI